MATYQASSGWEALGDPSRLAIVTCLAERPRAVRELADVPPISRPAVSRIYGCSLAVMSTTGASMAASAAGPGVGVRAAGPGGVQLGHQPAVADRDRAGQHERGRGHVHRRDPSAHPGGTGAPPPRPARPRLAGRRRQCRPRRGMAAVPVPVHRPVHRGHVRSHTRARRVRRRATYGQASPATAPRALPMRRSQPSGSTRSRH